MGSLFVNFVVANSFTYLFTVSRIQSTYYQRRLPVVFSSVPHDDPISVCAQDIFSPSLLCLYSTISKFIRTNGSSPITTLHQFQFEFRVAP